jgi:hypothetical protein
MNIELLSVSRETFFQALHQHGLVAVLDGKTLRVRHNPRADWDEAPQDVAAALRLRMAGDD